ncbi:hypothetical protein GCM10010400_41230 [Streptomyces aculeolatus]
MPVRAPEVFDNGAGITMHYTARDRASDKQCIGVALSATPGGPATPPGRSTEGRRTHRDRLSPGCARR